MVSAEGSEARVPIMWHRRTLYLLVLAVLLAGALAAYHMPAQRRARRVSAPSPPPKLRPQNLTQPRGVCPAPTVKHSTEQIEPLRFVRVEGCEVVWRNIYNDPRIPDLRIKYAGINPVAPGTAPATVFMVTRTIANNYLVSARAENGSYSRWTPPHRFIRQGEAP